MRLAVIVLTVLALAGCGSAPPARPAAQPERGGLGQLPQLPDSAGVPPHVLAIEVSPRGDTWVGTYGRGIYLLRRGGTEWQRLTSRDSSGISWDFVNSFAFTGDSLEVWYGTVGNGYGVTRDGGKTWRNWQFRQLGPEWQYVVPDGIRVHERTVYVATADGLRWSDNGGEAWHCIGGRDGVRGGTPERDGSCVDRATVFPSEYLLALDVSREGHVWVAHVQGVSYSKDRGRTWSHATGEGLPARVRDVVASDTLGVWALTEQELLYDTLGRGTFRRVRSMQSVRGVPGTPRALVARYRVLSNDARDRMIRAQQRQDAQGGIMRRNGQESASELARAPMVLTSNGAWFSEGVAAPRVAFIAAGERFRAASDLWAGVWRGSVPLAGSAAGLQRVLAGEAPAIPLVSDEVAQPEAPKHLWFRRPIADSGANPFIDGTYRYGSTMGGNFQQHQGVEFNNAAGTPVRAVGDGVVVFAGPGEQGANTVAVLHDQRWEGKYVFTTYYHNTALEVKAGQRVRAGDIVSRVGNTGRATNDHLHLEVHVAPTADSLAIVNPAERFPPFTVNPQLWIEPSPGTGIVAGRVFDAAGAPVPGARVYGLVVPYPTETPFSFAETYRERARSDPAYGDHFAVGDVSPGDYLVHVEIGGKRVWRRVRVAAGMVTFVEFRP